MLPIRRVFDERLKTELWPQIFIDGVQVGTFLVVGRYRCGDGITQLWVPKGLSGVSDVHAMCTREHSAGIGPSQQ